MSKLPVISARELLKMLSKIGYSVGSEYIRLRPAPYGEQTP